MNLPHADKKKGLENTASISKWGQSRDSCHYSCCHKAAVVSFQLTPSIVDYRFRVFWEMASLGRLNSTTWNPVIQVRRKERCKPGLLGFQTRGSQMKKIKIKKIKVQLLKCFCIFKCNLYSIWLENNSAIQMSNKC